ncbi:MAG: hypothetical protein QOH46_3246 [Solirubrobacteraceae bacterium]|jgi:hypothetical protein|nr:hypothetical protein [Solirubrobacteraceae bacterium]
MLLVENAATRATAHANAIVRLCSAREELWRAERRYAGARGTPAETWMLQRLGEASAEVGTREQWLHWLAHGTTVRPVADGEWGLGPEAEDLAPKRSAGQRPSRSGRANVTGVSALRDGTRRLHSVT